MAPTPSRQTQGRLVHQLLWFPSWVPQMLRPIAGKLCTSGSALCGGDTAWAPPSVLLLQVAGPGSLPAPTPRLPDHFWRLRRPEVVAERCVASEQAAVAQPAPAVAPAALAAAVAGVPVPGAAESTARRRSSVVVAAARRRSAQVPLQGIPEHPGSPVAVRRPSVPVLLVAAEPAERQQAVAKAVLWSPHSVRLARPAEGGPLAAALLEAQTQVEEGVPEEEGLNASVAQGRRGMIVGCSGNQIGRAHV